MRRGHRIRSTVGLAVLLLVASSLASAPGAAAMNLRFVPLDPTLGCPGPPIVVTALTADKRDALQARLDRYRLERRVPGISVAITFPDGSSWEGVSGFADLSRGTAVTPETAFAIASVSKTFTSALILALHDEGRIDLEASVATYLPELKLDRRITVHELLDHTSGLADFFFGPGIDRALLKDRAASWSLTRSLRYVGKRSFKPGQGWAYSNTNYILLALVAERVTGQSLGEQLRTRFFDPLGLHDTIEQVAERPAGPVAHGYAFDGKTPERPVDLNDGSSTRAPFTAVVTAARGAGSIASSARDLASWARALYGGRILTPATYAEMVGDATATTALRARIPYGLGVQAITIDGRPTLGHSGRLLGFRSTMRWLPNESVAIAVVSNQSRTDPAAITRVLLRIALDPDVHCP